MMADVSNPSTWASRQKPTAAEDAYWDDRAQAELRARRRLEDKFGIGAESANHVLRTNAGAKRIYDCALFALIDAELEIERLRAGAE
jgi:hypothetical protein